MTQEKDGKQPETAGMSMQQFKVEMRRLIERGRKVLSRADVSAKSRKELLQDGFEDSRAKPSLPRKP
jgi:hypothetical protein